ncbi:hypothetical protein [uncultured Tolumonas sp.]|uniref:hypothetical protein n=1 Tax=uncultured Tolumonas sp. TaxID=263765 RepID=UPI002A0A8E35|nr:hypothetical protein [uncultured Tolumonas sp.]
MKIRTDRTIIEILSSADAELMLNYYIENKKHLAYWEPLRNENYFTIDNFSKMLCENQKDFQEKKH